MDFQKIYLELQTLQPPEFNFAKYEKCASEALRTRRRTSNHNDTFATLCAVHIARLSAPQMPWDNNGVLRLFRHIDNALSQLAPEKKFATSLDTDHTIELLALVNQIQLAGCLVGIENADEVIDDLFTSGFRIAHSEIVPSKVKYLVCQFLTQIVEELDSDLPNDVVCLILDQFSGPGFELSVGIAKNCQGFAKNVQVYFKELLADVSASERFNQALELTQGVIEHSYDTFELSLPLFIDHLESLDRNARVMAVQVLGQVLTLQHDPLAIKALPTWIRRSNDAQIIVRVAWVKQAGLLLSRPSTEDGQSEVLAALENCLKDHDSRVRAASCEAIGLPKLCYPNIKELLAPRLRDKSLHVRLKAIETATKLYSRQNTHSLWILPAVLNVAYLGDPKSLGTIWTSVYDMLGLNRQDDLPAAAAQRVLVTISGLDDKSWKAFGAVYRHHRVVTKAVTGLVAQDHDSSEACLQWLSSQSEDSRLKDQLASLSSDQMSALESMTSPEISAVEVEAALGLLPDVVVHTVGAQLMGFTQTHLTALIPFLDGDWTHEAQKLLLLLSECQPDLFNAKVVADLIHLFESCGNTFALIVIGSLSQQNFEFELSSTAWNEVVDLTTSSDPELAVAAVRCLGFDHVRIAKAVDLVLLSLYETSSLSLLLALNELYATHPASVMSNERSTSVPSLLVRIVFKKPDISSEQRCAALKLLVTRLQSLVHEDPNNATKLSEPVLQFCRKILKEKTADPKLIETTAITWLKLARDHGKQTTIEDLVRLEEVITCPVVGALIRELRDGKVSLFYSPLLFLHDDTESLVKAGIPTLNSSPRDLGLMLAYLIYYLAAQRASLAKIVKVLKRYYSLILSSSTIESIAHVAMRIKQFRDVRDLPAATSNDPTPNSRYLYAVSELALMLLDHQRKVKGWPKKASITESMPLPSRMYQSTTSTAAAALVAETSFISELGSTEEVQAACGDRLQSLKRGVQPLCVPQAKKPQRRKSKLVTAIRTPAD